jgi:hypothetical protein
MIDVRLTPIECIISVVVGFSRQLRAKKGWFKSNRRSDLPGWVIHIIGAAGELAVCKHFGIYFDPALDGDIIGKADLRYGSQMIDVKTRCSEDYTGNLWVSNKDADSETDIYMLVIGDFPVMRIVGWAYKEEVETEEYLQDDGSWFVPRRDLRDIGELVVDNYLSSS